MHHVIRSTERKILGRLSFLHTSGPVQIGVFQFDCDPAQKQVQSETLATVGQKRNVIF